jgi:hypothetical protein
MLPIAQIRKSFLKKRLIPTVLRAVVRRKKRAARAALKVKQGGKADYFPKMGKRLHPEELDSL